MFVSAMVVQGAAPALVIPQDAIVVRDGFHYAFRVGTGDRVNKVKVMLGRRHGDRVELANGGLKAEDRVVSAGASFLNEGDLVRIVDAAPKK
jgi:multidrug efflux pump subunit AcrA (membrane-fusion protein)